MHNTVGVAADGRREVRVYRTGQPEVQKLLSRRRLAGRKVHGEIVTFWLGANGGGGAYMACGMQRVAKMLISFEKRGGQSAAVRLRICGLYGEREAGVWDTLETKGSLGSETAEREAARVCSGGVGKRTLWSDEIDGCFIKRYLVAARV